MLDPSTVEVLRRHRERVTARAAVAGVNVPSLAYVWSQDITATDPYRPDRVTSAFRTLTRRLGLPHVTFHALRHFSATTLAGQGVGIRTIAGRLGHANPSLTLRTYAHFLDAADRDAATAIGRLVAGLMTPSTAPDGLPVGVSQPQHSIGPGEMDLIAIDYGRDMVVCRARGVRTMTPQDHEIRQTNL